MQSVQDAPLVTGLFDLVQGAVHRPDPPEGLLHLAVVVQLADEEVGLGLDLVDGVPRCGGGLGGLDDGGCKGLGAEDVVLDRLGVRLPCAHAVGGLFVDGVYLCLRKTALSKWDQMWAGV